MSVRDAPTVYPGEEQLSRGANAMNYGLECGLFTARAGIGRDFGVV